MKRVQEHLLPGLLLSVVLSANFAQGQIPDPLVLDSHDREYIKLKLHKVQLYRYSEELHRYFLDFRGSAQKEENPKWTDVVIRVTVLFNNGSKVAFDAWANFEANEQSTEISGSPSALLGNEQSLPFQPSDIKSWQVQLASGHYLSFESVPTFAGLIAVDLGCYKDLLNADSLEGVERREAILKLIILGCASFVENPMEVVDQDATTSTAVHVRLLLSNWPKEDTTAVGYVKRGDIQSRALDVIRSLRP